LLRVELNTIKQTNKQTTL